MCYVALLRGINVNPATTLAMGDLRALLTRLGYGGVRTHLRSGNALFTAAGDADSIAAAIERELYVYFPDGLRRPKLPPLLEKHSTGPATMRNWNTVTRLLALAEDREEISG
ncbi:DUF1697 domain-containing protein [Microbispora hainanensis]|uniref:DUF1697 domain-containing protein n=1 Tax=Microbispora hainanensis TaxID=568844 RepID=A0A544YSK6_9ACTN|nr:DUF1697 domain-containing protein [Microbispora hainanensis]TQS19532.1 DUF1697 domain-containing protein [Microbispora hainanensis]